MKDTSTQLADDVNSLARDLDLLVAAATGNIDDDNRRDICAAIEGYGQELPALDDPDDDTDDSADDELSELARIVIDEAMLELIQHGTRTPGDDWEATHVIVVFCTGGPHIELDTERNMLEGRWGSDRRDHRVDEATSDYFTEMFA